MNSLFKGPAWLYLLVINLPTVIFFWFWLESGTPVISFIIFGIVDPFIYRPIMDYLRLTALGKIEENYKEIMKFGTIGYRFNYYDALMFGKE